MTVVRIAVLLVGLGHHDAAAQAPVPELTPAGWTMRVSTNSIYFTRPDLPNIQVGFVNDIRPQPDREGKFESAKNVFARSAGCPDLATAETEGSFGGYLAYDDAEAPRCYLVGLGHWREGGMQLALVLNETPSAGPKPGDGVFDAIIRDIVQYALYRGEVGDTDQEVSLPVEAFAGNLSPDDGPAHILSFVDDEAAFAEAMTALEILNAEPGDALPRRDTQFRPVLLFDGSGGSARRFGSLCADWDPGFFPPDAITRYHADSDCFRFEWRWKDGAEGGEVEVKPIGGDWMPLTEHLREERGSATAGVPYRPFYRGRTHDLKLGHLPATLGRVARGELPITELGPNDAILTADGRIMLGHLEAASLPDPEPSGATYRPVAGTYFFAGHLITLKLDDGHVVRGFGGWLPGDGEEQPGEGSTLMINGVHYMMR